MTTRPKIVWNLLAVLLALGVNAAPHAHRLATWSPAVVDTMTTGLYSFDGTSDSPRPTANSHPTGVPCQFVGDVTGIRDGRFAGGLMLRGDGAVVAESPIRNFTVASQLRLAAAPAKPQRLLTIAPQAGAADRLQVLLLPDGRLQVDAYGRQQAISPSPVPLGEWLHVAVVGRAAYVNRSWQGDVELLVNGRPVIQLLKQPGLVNQRSTTLTIGGDGCEMALDDLHISRVEREFYADELDWVTPGAAARFAVAPPQFRAGTSTLALGFDGALTETPEAGVHGDAGVVGLGQVPAASNLRGPTAGQGSVAFWLRPIDWDNLKRDNPYDRAGPLQMPLLELLSENPGLGGATTAKSILRVGVYLEPSEKWAEVVPFTPGAWRHVAITWDGERQTIYVDGERSSGQGLAITWPTNLAETVEARHLAWAADAPAQTAVDDLRVFARALSPPELRNLAALYDTRRDPVDLPQVYLESDVNGVLGAGELRLWRLDGSTAASTCTLALTGPDGATIMTTTTAVPATGFAALTVTPGPLGFGAHRWTASFGADQPRGELAVERRPPPWWGTDIGEEETVPPGWDAVTVTDQVVSVLRRRLHLAASGLPSRLESAGGDVLAAPLSVDLQVSGRQEIMMPDESSLEVLQTVPTRATWSGRATSESVVLTTSGSMEFDGMIWLELELAPRAETPVVVEALTIRIPYAAESAELFHWWSGDMFFGDGRTFRQLTNTNTGAALPAGQGVLFRSNDDATVRRPPELRGSFIPYLMITGMNRGMAWFAESDRGWTPSTETPAVSVERSGEAVTLVLRVISEPVTISDSRRLAFGLHPVPVKRLPANWRMRDVPGVFPDAQTGNNLKGSKIQHFDLLPGDEDWEAVAARISGQGTTEDYAGKMQAEAAAQRAAFREVWGREPAALETTRPGIYWNQAWIGHLPAHTAEWQAAWYRRAWVTYDEDFLDYASWALDQWLSHTGDFLGGIYMDDMWASPQLNGPSTYALADGHVQPGWQWRAYRQRYLRMRRIFLAHGIQPTLVAHNTNTYYMPYHSMFDVVYDGEWKYAKPPDQQTFMDRWPADRLRFAHHDKWGIITTWLSWSGAEEASYRQEYPAWSYRQARAYIGHLAAHDIHWRFDVTNVYDRPSAWQRDIGIRDSATNFIPYWRTPALARHAHGDALRISAWRLADGRCLALLVNRGETRLDAVLTMDPAAMGFAADARLTARDVDPSLRAVTEEADATTLTPDAAPDGIDLQAAEPADGDADMALELDLEATPAAAVVADPDAAFSFQDGVLRCPIRPDDFRLIEFTLREE